MPVTIESENLQQFLSSIYLNEYYIESTIEGWQIKGIDESGTIYQEISISRDQFVSYETMENIGIIDHTFVKKAITPFEGLLELHLESGRLVVASLSRKVNIPLGIPTERQVPGKEIPFTQEPFILPLSILKKSVSNMDLLGAPLVKFEADGNQMKASTRSTKGELEELHTIPARTFRNQLAGILKDVLPCIQVDTVQMKIETDLPFVIEYEEEGIRNKLMLAPRAE